MNRKTIFLKTAFLLACLITGTFIASAYTCEVDGIYYSINSGRATVTYKNTNYNSYSGDVIIPDTVTYNGINYPVTSIGSSAFRSSAGLTSVSIPNTVTTINGYAFYDCNGLANIAIGNSVSSIGNAAFYNCNNLTRVDITDVEAWCKIYFDAVSSNPLFYAHHLYLNGTEVTNLVLPSSISSIKQFAFSGWTALISVMIPNSVTSIGTSAFDGCTSLTGLDIPNSVTNIAYRAFRNCSGMTRVSIPNSITFIGYSAFEGCTGLTRVDITDLEAWCTMNYQTAQADYLSNPLYYAHHLYLNGTEITNLVIPSSITGIQRNAFIGCSGIISITIPSTVTAIGDRAFDGCSSLKSIEIPNSVKTIGSSAFNGCNSLKSLKLSNSLTTLSASVFAGCNSLTSLDIPNSITSIGNRAFYGCSSLTSLGIPNSVTSIGNSAFHSGSTIKSVTIPNSVTSIGSSAFYGCKSLKSLEIPNSVASIGEMAFEGCSGLTSVSISSSISIIEKRTFSGCSGLTSITIPNSVNQIKGASSNEGAFYNCSSLKSIVIPNSVTSIDNNVFRDCKNLTHVAFVGDGEWVNANNGRLFQYVKTLSIGSGITAIRGLQCAPTEVWRNALVPPVCDDNTFTSYSGALHVPAEAMVAYFMADYWQNFSNLNTDAGGKVTLNQREATIDLGETLQLSAVVDPTGSTLVWQSSNPNIAMVTENGLVAAVGVGECDIIATQSPNIVVADTCHITVTPGEITLTLSEDSLMMQRGEETTLILTIEPSGTLLTPVWASSDENVATVTDGVVRAVGNGECDITATVFDKTATCHVTVGGQVVITLDQTSATVAVGSIITLYPTATPDVELELTATSSDPTVAVARVVNRVNGASAAPAPVSSKMVQVIGIKDGRVTITVDSADGSAIPATVEVTVGNGGFTPGDMNGDGLINISDVTTLIDNLLNYPVIDNPAADVNGDGVVNISDVTVLIDRLLKS